MTVQIFTESLTAPEKERLNQRCGDFVKHEIVAPGHTHLLALSDGVGAHSYDWAASERTCQSVSEAFAAAEGDMTSRLHQAVDRAHQDVQDLRGPAAGATATLVLFAWAETEDVAYYVSIGDSRFYLVRPGGVELLTEDDSTSVPVKMGGELVTEGGAVKFAPGLTRAVGFGVLGDIDVGEVPFRNGDMLAAITDGHHELAGFEARLALVFDRPDLASGVRAELGAAHQRIGRDDASVALLRRAAMPTVDLDAYLAAIGKGLGASEAGLPRHLMTRVCVSEMDRMATAGDTAELARVLEYVTGHDLTLSQSALMPVLDHLALSSAADAKPLLDALVQLARKAGSGT